MSARADAILRSRAQRWRVKAEWRGDRCLKCRREADGDREKGEDKEMARGRHVTQKVIPSTAVPPTRVLGSTRNNAYV